ncbi:hypothetical protein Pint_29394 [Pistacia integerrima]|uniref:Uncharacterized protein n=1 Tax=Pistacia integerrima TaxID=434235 RepID=A0ACC0WXP6_9ROSI|nr:hypothetical protein Pint_29394 [Pistacia integerrima]
MTSFSDNLAQFSNLPIFPPYVQPGAHQFTDGTNFASTGASVLDETHPRTIRLRLQLSYFKDVAKSLKRASFSQTKPKASQSSKGKYVKTVIGNLTSMLKALGDRVANPSKYGFKEENAACYGSGPYRGMNYGNTINGTQSFELCSNPREYVWFDGGHTTERANTQLAQLL